MKILGIDPGLDGGLVLMDAEGRIESYSIMPVIESYSKYKKRNIRNIDIKKLIQIFEQNKNIDIIILELQHARPGEGTSSSFKAGYSFGAIVGILESFRFNYKLVNPVTWCAALHGNLDSNLPAKERSLIVFKRLFPAIDFRLTERCKKFHEGLVDAALIAEWGRRQVVQYKLF